jgi:hypothetical protein
MQMWNFKNGQLRKLKIDKLEKEIGNIGTISWKKLVCFLF